MHILYCNRYDKIYNLMKDKKDSMVEIILEDEMTEEELKEYRNKMPLLLEKTTKKKIIVAIGNKKIIEKIKK